MDSSKGDKVLDRRQFLLGIAAWTSSVALLSEIQTALAQNRREEIEQLVQSGRIVEAIRIGKEDIKSTYGIDVRFPNRNTTFRAKSGETIAYSTLSEGSKQLSVLLELRRYLLKFPPKSVPSLLHLHPTYLQTVDVLSALSVALRNRDRREPVDGLAFSGEKRIALRVTESRDSDGRLRFLIDKTTFTHEVAHKLLNEVSEEDWVARVNAKINADKYRDRFPPGYIYTPGYVHAELSTHDVAHPRPLGYARSYGRQSADEDMATIAEHIFHSSILQSEIDAETPPILLVKIEVLKEILASKLGYTGMHAGTAQHYWSLVGTSAFTDSMFADVHDPQKIEQIIAAEFQRWEGWWNLFKK